MMDYKPGSAYLAGTDNKGQPLYTTVIREINIKKEICSYSIVYHRGDDTFMRCAIYRINEGPEIYIGQGTNFHYFHDVVVHLSLDLHFVYGRSGKHFRTFHEAIDYVIGADEKRLEDHYNNLKVG